MQKSKFHRHGFRLFSSFFAGLLLMLPGCSGCLESKTLPPPGEGTAPEVRRGATTVIPHVEPMVPKPQDDTGAVPLKSAFFGKIAQQAVPLPPIADLAAQADDYLEKIGSTLKDLDGTSDYKKDADAVVRDANGLMLVALAVALSPEDGKYKKAAPGIIAAALALEKVDKYDAANKAYADLKAAFESSGDPATLGWTKVAALGPVMKAVPNLDSAVKRLGNTERKLKRAPEKVFAPFAGMAAIAQGSIANIKETIKPDAEAEWKKECEIFRDAAIKANAVVHAFIDGQATYADYDAAYTSFSETCESCHKIFNPATKQ